MISYNRIADLMAWHVMTVRAYWRISNAYIATESETEAARLLVEIQEELQTLYNIGKELRKALK